MVPLALCTHDWKEGTRRRARVFPWWDRPVRLPTIELPLLHHDRISADGVEPGRWIVVLHGIFGSGRNWASVARRLVRRRPEWGVLLVDLRLHGASQGLSPPHTIAACAADVDRLVGALAGC